MTITESTKTPVLLFPLKIETRFVGDELWLRIFPDEAFLQSHEPNLSEQELEDRNAYKAASDKFEAWELLVDRYGAYRAAYLVQVKDAFIAQNDVAQAEAEQTFFYKGLPEKFHVYLYPKDGKRIEVIKNAVENAEHLVAFGDGDEWVEDFEQAIDEGMAFKITKRDLNLDNTEDFPTVFERIIVTGFYYRHSGNRQTNDLKSAEGLQELFENHLYTEGISFLDYGTPTNNIDNDRSGYSIKDEFETAENYKVLVEGNALTDGTPGGILAKGLGIDNKVLQHFKGTEKAASKFPQLFQKLTWMALGGQSLQMIFGDSIPKETHQKLWQYYTEHVHARGKFATLKIDDQPYGILPVTTIGEIQDKISINTPIRDAVLSAGDAEDVTVDVAISNTYLILSILFQRWMKLLADGLYVPSLADNLDGNSLDLELYRVLSMQPSSGSHHFDVQRYEKLRGKIEDWIQEQLGISEDLGKLSIGEAYEKINHLLASNDSKKRQYANILNLVKELKSLLEDIPLESRGDALAYAPIFSLKNTGEQLTSEDLFQLEAEDIAALRAAFEQVKVDAQQYKRTGGYRTNDGIEVQTTWINYRRPATLVSDLLLRSYANTMSLYQDDEAALPSAMTNFANDALQMLNAWDAIESETERTKLVQSSIAEVLDVNSYRLDAWISSIANSRLEALRANKPKGIYFGAYAWVEDLEKDTEKIVDARNLTDENREDEGGFIHCPTPAQSLVGTLFKNAYLSSEDQADASNPFTLNLTSDRIQQSEQFMQGIRQDQEIEALLGYKLERYLHEAGLNSAIYELREAFPLEVNIINRTDNNPDIGFKSLSVINGLAFIDRQNDPLLRRTLNGTYTRIIDDLKLRQKLEDILDSSLDHLFFEAGFQLTQGNLSQSAAAMDAAKGALEPPATDALKTKIPGVGLSHKLVYLFPLPGPEDTISINNAKAFISPYVEIWLQEQLGDLSNIACTVQFFDEDTLVETKEVSLDQLNIGYSDLLYMSEHELSDGTSELEVRIVQATAFDAEQFTANIMADPPEGKQSLVQAVEVLRYAKQLLSKSRYVKTTDLALGGEEIAPNWTALKLIHDNLRSLYRQTTTRIDTPDAHKQALAQLQLTEAKRAYLSDSAIDIAALNQEIKTMLPTVEGQLLQFMESFQEQDAEAFYPAFEQLQKAAQAFFGKDFILLPPTAISEKIVKAVGSNQQQRLIGDANMIGAQERIQTWMQEIAQVREGAATFEEWQMLHSIWQEDTNTAFQILQNPTSDNYPWIGLSKTEINTLLESAYYEGITAFQELEAGQYYPDGGESIVLFRNTEDELKANTAQFGIVMEEFDEHVPYEKMDTGLSFHYNAPNNEAPQALLLAVPPPFAPNSWNEKLLADIIQDTMDLMKIRMIDLDAIQVDAYNRGMMGVPILNHLLPMANWFNIPTIN